MATLAASFKEWDDPRPIIAVREALASLPTLRTLRAETMTELCSCIANSEERISAIAIAPRGRDLTYKRFLNRVWAVANAEGAKLIWDGDRELVSFYEISPDFVVERSADHVG